MYCKFDSSTKKCWGKGENIKHLHTQMKLLSVPG